MTLRVTTGNWFFRWAYLFTTQQTRDRMEVTTLCDMFWRAVLLTPLEIVALTCPVVGLALVAHDGTVVSFLMHVAIVVAVATSLLAVIFAAIWIDESVRGERHNTLTTIVTFTKAGVGGIKERYCPIVRVDGSGK